MIHMLALAEVPYHVEMTNLCPNSKTFLGVFAMVCIILSILFFIANYFWNSGKPKTSKKPLLWWAGTLVFVLSVVSIAVYIVLPPIITALRGPDYVSTDPCDPYYTPEKAPLKDCGENCIYNGTTGEFVNCTCT